MSDAALSPCRPLVTVWPHREIPGWDGRRALDELTPCPTMDLNDAVGAKYETDAHMWPGYVLDENGDVEPWIPRLRKVSLPTILRKRGKVLFGLIVLDVDCPEAHK